MLKLAKYVQARAPKRQARREPAIFKTIVPALLVAVLSLVVPSDLYADTGTWVDGDFPVLTTGQQVDTTSGPAGCFPTVFTYWSYTKPSGAYDIIGRPVDVSTCATENQLGFFGGTGYHDEYNLVRPHTSYAFQVLDARSSSYALTPVPNQAVFLAKDSSQSFHGEVAPHFYDDFASAGSFGPAGNMLVFTVNKPGTILTDSAGAKIYMHAYAFSRNGEWMVMEARGLGLIRVNTLTRGMQLFDPVQLSYSFGYSPQMTLAISNDGNTVIKSGSNASDTWAYDLSGCIPGSFTIGTDNAAAMQGCRKRSLQNSLSAQLSSFLYLTAMRFSADGKSISAIATRTGALGQPEHFTASYAVAGYVAPHLSYLALGDSFSSGEGAYDYELGTNEPENTCHLSKLSYPYLAAQAADITDFHSVACSGAEVKDYLGPEHLLGYISNPLRNALGVWQPGYQAQKTYLTQSVNTSVVTISMIGNDIGFQAKLLRCLSPTDSCFHFQEDRRSIADEIYGKFDTLYQLYTSIKENSGNESNVKVYVLGYPQIIGTGPDCGINPAVVPFDQEERQMAQGLITYLNAVIRAAAVKAGVQYVDVEHAFAGHMLCEDGTKAVNGVTIDNNVPNPFSKGNSSFHPNALGHQLMSEALVSQSQNFTKGMPAADLTKRAPYSESEEYKAFVNSAPAGGTFSRLVYEATGITNVGYKAANLSVYVTEQALKQNTQFQVWFHSTSTLAGTLTSDGQSHLVGQVAVPASIEPGYHMVDITGMDMANTDVDIYAPVYIAASPDDFDGDGILNSQDSCSTIANLGIDSDHDGIDDACDGDIASASVDTVPPVVTAAVDRGPDYNGWYNHDATINWSASDPDPSSGSPTQPDATLATVEGDSVYTSGESCDPAGNCATGSIELKLDKTEPSITFTIDPLPNADGWNNSAAVVRFTCADVLSGVASCTEPVTVSGSDGSYVVSGAAVDNAGNTSSVNAIVNLDATPPQVSNHVSSEPNPYGWYGQDVTVSPSCSDNLSGVAACSQEVTISQDGANQAVTSSAVDYAGNTRSTTTVVNLDKTAPVVDAIAWTNNPKATLAIATLTVHASDNLSGVVSAEYFLGDTDPGFGKGVQMGAAGGDFTANFGSDIPTGVYKVSVRSRDAAGNWGAVMSDYLVVYNPFSVRMTGKRSLVPSLTNGDRLPGLVDSDQTDTATFAFSVGYDRSGDPLSDDLQFYYETGTGCKKAAAASGCCHLQLNATSAAWFTTSGVNNSTGIFAGDASMNIDGVTQQVSYMVTGLDGDRLDRVTADHVALKIFAAGSNQSTATPLYQVDDDIGHGNIRIQL